MLRIFTILPCLAALCGASFAVAAEDGFSSLFNGKDLEGWEGDPDLWSVEAGAITGKTRGPGHLPYNKFLVWKGGEVADFELRLKFRLEGNNNSGVQYRSRLMPDKGVGVVGGYQADIHSKPEYTGMLYEERGRGILAQRGQKVVVDAQGKQNVSKLPGAVAALDLQKWHTLTIVARGNRLIHKLDGQTAVEIVDEQKSERELSGIVALQVHRGPAMKVQFKDIELKKLPAQKAAKKTARARRKKGPRPEEINPSWIWLKQDGQPVPKAYFRKEFVVQGAIAAARLYATCDNEMTIYLDGQKLLTHGSWDQPVYADLTKMFEQPTPGGRHVLSVEGVNQAGQPNPAGLLVKLAFESGWRDAWAVVSDTSWQVATQPQPGWQTSAFQAKGWQASQEIAALGGGPWASVTAKALAAVATLKEPTATPPETLHVAKGFHVELLYSVPKSQAGSWVNMCVDPRGRLIVSDQYGGLFRVTPPRPDSTDTIKLEKINVDIGEAQGLLWAFDSLYVVVNRGKKYASGLYRVRDTDGDDQLDKLETLRLLEGGGEHGPHALLLAPDGRSLYVVCGDGTKLTQIDRSRVPQVWDEDVLLPRPYGKGFMKGKPAPGGYVCRIDPDGQNWELVSTGFRNQFDAALNADGELFTYDADMEWDMNTPWYRPTRICHVVSGSEFGWRNGGGKWPVYYADSLPAVVDVGPGSPTGICFGYGTRFPARYQNALFICDWSYGKLYAVHLQPTGALYTGVLEEFVTGTPLPLTDVVVNPHDQALYFTIGGRRVQSGLYRVTYRGQADTARVSGHQVKHAAEREQRKQLERQHLSQNPRAVQRSWDDLGNEDRFIRYAARIAVEQRPLSEWQERALQESNPQHAITALLALVRQVPRERKGQGPDLDTPAPTFPSSGPRHELHAPVLQALNRIPLDALSVTQKLELLRVYGLAFLRLGPPNEEMRKQIIARLDALYPAKASELNAMLAELLVYLQAPTAAGKTVQLLAAAPTQEEQIDYARHLRHLRVGWNPELQREYFSWFVKAAGYRGGASFGLFVKYIKDAAAARLSAPDRERLQPILEAKPTGTITPAVAPRSVVKEWKFSEVVPLVERGLTGRDFDRGRQMFAAGKCFACHRFDNEGGAVGPDLTVLAGRFSPRDILESILDPNKVISDQYAAVQIVTLDGKITVGRIVNLAGDSMRVNTNMLDPNAQVNIDRKQIEEIIPSKTSMMPTGLFNTLQEDEILDLMAYLLSRGDRNHAMFQQ